MHPEAWHDGAPMEDPPVRDPFVDCHVHLWDPDRFSYPALASDDLAGLPDRFTAHDFLEAAGELLPAAAVHVQAEVDHATDPVAETAWLQGAHDAAATGGIPAVHVAYADLSRRDVADVLDRHLEHPIVRGIRQELWWEDPPSRPDIAAVDYLAMPAWRAGLGQLATRGLAFDLTCFARQLDQVRDVLAGQPDVTVVVDHLGAPDLDDEEATAAWRRSISRLADLEQVCCKISGIVQLQRFAADWRVARVRPLFDVVLDAFGPDRCVLGTNFPIETIGGATYAQVRHALDELVAPLSADERRALRSRTAARVYRIDGIDPDPHPD